MHRGIVGVVSAALALAACTSGADEQADSRATPDASNRATTTRPPRPAEVPDVDLTRSDVALADVVFDTFDGGFVSLADSDEQLRTRLRDAIPPLDDPRYEPGDATDWLAHDDLVVGFVAGAQSYAFPVRILNAHEIVNDRFDGVPVLVSYCPLCRSGVVYDRRVGDRELSFSNTSALHDSDLVMVDRQTGSYWWQVAGRAIVGELTGVELEALPSELAVWGDWFERHPDTLTLSRDTGFSRRYERDVFSRYDEAVAAGEFAFPVGDAAADDRLGAADIVVAVTVGDVAVAYPVARLVEPVDDVIDGVAVRITPHEFGATVTRDDGESIGTRTAFWFSIVSAFPDVEIRTP